MLGLSLGAFFLCSLLSSAVWNGGNYGGWASRVVGFRSFQYEGLVRPVALDLQGGPLPVIDGVITPINGRKQIGNWGYNATFRVYNSTYNDRRGPPGICSKVFFSTQAIHDRIIPPKLIVRLAQKM